MTTHCDECGAPTREVWIVVDQKFGRRVGPEYATKREARAIWPSYSRYDVQSETRPVVDDARTEARR